MWNRCLILLVLSLLVSPLSWGWQAHATERIDFRTQVAPILQQHCLRCHSDGKSSGALSLTNGTSLVEQNLVAPGKPDQSRLIEVLLRQQWANAPRCQKKGRL